ncbi:hypothetical protein Ddc_05915 [Ditylenchus destructor]|nr:hypothetical protein Ddc_05915 [Ditylenchus destructor]
MRLSRGYGVAALNVRPCADGQCSNACVIRALCDFAVMPHSGLVQKRLELRRSCCVCVRTFSVCRWFSLEYGVIIHCGSHFLLAPAQLIGLIRSCRGWPVLPRLTTTIICPVHFSPH